MIEPEDHNPSEQQNRTAGVRSCDETSMPHHEILPMVMPGESEEVKAEIAHVSVEGEPADAKSGPGMLSIELVVAVLSLLAMAVIVAFFANWIVALAVVAIGLVGMVFNPVVPATLMRVRERREVAERHLHNVPGAWRKT